MSPSAEAERCLSSLLVFRDNLGFDASISHVFYLLIPWIGCAYFSMLSIGHIVRRGECHAQSFSAKPRSYDIKCFNCSTSFSITSSEKLILRIHPRRRNLLWHVLPPQRSAYRNKEKLKALNHNQHLLHACFGCKSAAVVDETTLYVMRLIGLR